MNLSVQTRIQELEAANCHLSRLLEVIVEEIPAAFLVAEAPSGRLQHGNRRAAKLIGQPIPLPTAAPGGDALNAALKGARPDGSLYQPKDWPLMRSLIEGEEIEEEEIHVTRTDGSPGTLSASAAPVRDRNGNIVAAVTALWDIADRKALEHRLTDSTTTAAAIEAAEGANRSKDDLIFAISHELRTPLSIIRLWSRLLGSGKLPQGEWTQGIAMIDRAALAQQQLIDDLLDASGIASGKSHLVMQDIRLNDVVKSAIARARSAAEGRHITLEAHLDEEVGVVSVDPDRIQQVVSNLLMNALRLTPSGSTVRIVTCRTTGSVEVCVADSGSGVRQDFLPHLFESSPAKLDPARQHVGPGLALMIAKQLVELHGGKISVASEGEGLGSNFQVVLPLSGNARAP